MGEKMTRETNGTTVFRPALGDVRQAAGRIAGLAHRTPVLTSTAINDMAGTSLFFKAENFQKAGAFKFRGALNAVSSLTDDQLARGVVTFSSGNHGAALALAAGLRGAPARVAVPANTPDIKRRAMAGYGAEISVYEPGLENRRQEVAGLIDQTGGQFIHPFNHPAVIAGQGTACLEMMEDIQGLETIIAPVGGGGLISGTATAARGLNPEVNILGAEPAWSDFGRRSLEAGKVVTSDFPPTIADGLRGGPSQVTFPLVRDLVAEIIPVSEAEIAAAMRLMWERMKIVVEPSAAVPLAAILKSKDHPALAGRRVGIIVSGGNVDLDNLPW